MNIAERAIQPGDLREPPFSRYLFADTRMSWLWLIVRVYLGYEWLSAGLGKLGAETWTGAKAGAAIRGFAKGALAKTTGEHPDVTGWYAAFLQNVVSPNAALFAWLVTVGEILVGIALILGALTGIAAFAGIVLNANYLLAGTVSSNPVLIILGTLVVLAWRNAGWIGLDRLPLRSSARRGSRVRRSSATRRAVRRIALRGGRRRGACPSRPP